MRKFFKMFGLMASIPVALASSPVLAESYDDVFASRVSIYIEKFGRARQLKNS